MNPIGFLFSYFGSYKIPFMKHTSYVETSSASSMHLFRSRRKQCYKVQLSLVLKLSANDKDIAQGPAIQYFVTAESISLT